MNVFELIIVIVVFVTISGMFGQWLKYRNKAPAPDDRRVEQLEERVRVLEQIVTDSGYDLRRQFRDLEREA